MSAEKPTKRLVLKREKIRVLNVRTRIKAGSSSEACLTSVAPSDSVPSNGPPPPPMYTNGAEGKIKHL
jgi:hypothetical protein